MLSAEAQAKRHQTWVRQAVGAGVPLGHGTQAGPCGAEPGPTVAHSVTVRTASASTRSKPASSALSKPLTLLFSSAPSS